MKRIKAEVSREVEAPAERVYGVLADYREGHRSILPEGYFKELQVESGGTGPATMLRVKMSVMGTTREFRQVVSEPEPGRVLVEAELDGDAVTTFTVDPLGSDERCQATIETEARVRPGLIGWMEGLLIPGLLRRIYRAELDQLAAYVAAEKA